MCGIFSRVGIRSLDRGCRSVADAARPAGQYNYVSCRIGYAFFDEARYFDGRLLSALVLVYAFGEIWEFIVSFFGIRRHKVSWGAVFLIAVGTFIGAVIGTGFFPVLGSVLGGAVGSYIVAFGYEFMRTRNKENAFALAWKAAQTQFVAMLGKIVASFAMALLLFKQIFLNN